jgi:hypothetical protein
MKYKEIEDIFSAKRMQKYGLDHVGCACSIIMYI